MSIAAAYYAGKVLRWHANPAVSVVRQTNADHVAGCLTLLFKLVAKPSVDLVRAVLFHDAGERFAGYLPYPFKRKFRDIAVAHARAEGIISRRLAGTDLVISLEDDALLHLVDLLESFAHVATFFPDELNRDGWPEAIEDILNLSAGLGLNKQVAEFIGDMKLRRFDLPEAR